MSVVGQSVRVRAWEARGSASRARDRGKRKGRPRAPPLAQWQSCEALTSQWEGQRLALRETLASPPLSSAAQERD